MFHQKKSQIMVAMMKSVFFILLTLTNFYVSLALESLTAEMWDEITKFLEENSTDSKLNLDPNLGNNPKDDCQHECVPFYLCRNGTINTDGSGILDIRQKDGPCSNMFEVCCRREDISSTPLTTTPSPISYPRGCGYRRPNGLGVKIIGDELNESQIGEFPWMVAVIPEKEMLKLVSKPKCGGALIHSRAAITVAHCVSNRAERFVIRAGDWDISTDTEPYTPQDVAVKSVKLHPEFHPKRLTNDIAILYLEDAVKITANVDVICLPRQNQQHLFGLSNCIATGWGKDRFDEPAGPHKILKKLHLPVVPSLACQHSLRHTRLGPHFNLHKSFMCAGGEKGRDTCSGDGGSPLVCPLEGEEGRYYQAGIVSWGIGCGEENVPGVYVDVAMFRDWIDQQLEFYGLLENNDGGRLKLNGRFRMRFDMDENFSEH
ncbi:unnamed protein product [Phaedon cochleariae]|uniref:Phenoloxidase-activating factor 2 n=1 Tax=Phaedon cochleariae TaxID=80249 RepID=A0A9P0DN60_PHACE|nr:unnamed protein product [Phaedon cochleariae]